MSSTLFGRMIRRPQGVEVFVPQKERLYYAPGLSASPSEVRPIQGGFVRAEIGTKEECAVAATFARVCADIDDDWHGIALRDLIDRLNNEADRVEAGQQAIRETVVNYWPWQNKRRKRFHFYKKGVDACLKRGLLRCEKLDGQDVISATPKLVQVFLRPPVADLSSF